MSNVETSTNINIGAKLRNVRPFQEHMYINDYDCQILVTHNCNANFNFHGNPLFKIYLCLGSIQFLQVTKYNCFCFD